MRLSHITIHGFKSFAKKTTIDVTHQVTGVVGPNGSGKSNIAEAIRFVLGEQSMKSMRGKTGSDVIFKGSSQLGALSRASVTMVIDNKDKSNASHVFQASADLAPYLVYDELVLSRVIFADGTSDYLLNDAKLRLKDVQELLSLAGIGSSAHTIINQGEADRILLASPKDRKEALEDALGLRVYHMRLHESKRKLERVKSHVREVELLRAEIKPHLAHLERQVKKIESQSEERNNLHRLLIAYLTREEHEINLLRERINEQGTSFSLRVITDSIRKELDVVRSNSHDGRLQVNQERHTILAELRVLKERKDQITKSLGRMEAEKSYLEKEINRDVDKKDILIPYQEFIDIHADFSNGFKSISHSIITNDVASFKTHVDELSHTSEVFFGTHSMHGPSIKEKAMRELTDITAVIQDHEVKEKQLANEIIFLESKITSIDTEAQKVVVTRHEEEKKIMSLESKLRELDSVIALRTQEEGELSLRTQYFDALVQEGVVIIGNVILDYKSAIPEERYATIDKHDLMRAIERSKLRIEEASVPNRADVIEEYRTVKAREEYLIKELSDIMATEATLLTLIDELTNTLFERFASGVTTMSSVFGEFFAEIFPGGTGKLTMVTLSKIDEEGLETTDKGIEIDVSLPNKKVKELSMFSGGERALVSIALLFAMSSITPPPFMVLDETDAPLDESNARKYGLMLARLSEKSKLLVITHNRETMNHCDMLYGVTIGVDGSSKLLSVNFKEAEGLVQ